MVAIPFAAFGGIRKLTWYPSSEPGKPTAASTSAEIPFTFTSMGELTVAAGLDGKGCPGSTAGTVGPSPVANRDKTSPAAAGLDEVTGEKSLEWVTPGPVPVVMICGADIGIR